MNKIPIDLIIPIYNEGEKIIELFQKFNLYVKTKYRILLCYDNDDDNIFQQKDVKHISMNLSENKKF